MITKDHHKRPFLKNILVLTSGAALAAIINIITAPFFTRLFSPENIGLYSYILSAAQLFIPVMNARYDMSIVSEENEDLIFPIINLSLIISVFLSIIVSIGFGAYFFFSNKHSYLYAVGILPIILLSSGIINVLSAYNNRIRDYKTLSFVQVIRASFQNIVPVIWGYINPNVLGLLLPYTIGQILGLNYQFRPLKQNLKDILKVTRKELLKVLKLHYRQPFFSSPALFANAFSYSSITFFIEILFDMSIVGYYSLSMRLLGLPLSIISGNVSKVFYEEASREYDQDGQFYKTFLKTSKFLILLAIPMVATLMGLPSKIYGVIFGEEWIIAGTYIKILAPMFGFRLVVSTLTSAFQIVKKQNYELILQILFLFASFIPFIFTKAFSLSIESFLLITSISKSVIFVFFFFVILKFSRSSHKYVGGS